MADVNLKTFGWFFGAVVGLAALSLALWVGYNLWPRPLPPLLFSEAELAVPQTPSSNAWEAVQNLRRSSEVPWEEVEVPEELGPLLGSEAAGDKKKIPIFWEEAERLQAPLKAFLQKNPTLTRQLLDISELTQWVDVSSAKQPFSSRSLIVFMDYHKWISLYWIHLTLEGNTGGAYSLWRKVYVQDLAWLSSARSFLSHLIAANYVRQDLEYLLLLISDHPPASAAEWIQWLRVHPPGSPQLSRAVKYEYLERLNQLESVVAAPKNASLSAVFRMLLNSALLREELNKQFLAVDKVLRGPPHTWRQGMKRLDLEVAGLRQGIFWWFANPGGKSLLQLVHVSLVEPAADFAEQGEKAKRLYQRSLIELREIGHARLNAPPTVAEIPSEEEPSPSPEAEKMREDSPVPSESPNPSE